MNDILDLPPILNDSPNYRNKIYFVFGLCVASVIYKILDWPGQNLILVFVFGYHAGFTLVGRKNKFHPANLFRISLIIAAAWLLQLLIAPLIFPQRSLNFLATSIYAGVAALTYIALQVKHHVRKQRGNNSPG